MAQYPPPPPGGGWGPAPPGNPYDMFNRWLADRGYQFVSAPDIRFYQAWRPFNFIPSFTAAVREVRAQFHEATVYVVEVRNDDPFAGAFDSAALIIGFVTSPRFPCRVALRSKSGGTFSAQLNQGIDDLFGSKPRSPLGDPTLEAQYEVQAPSPQEGNAALPIPMRQRLVTGYRGIVELRPQGLIAQSYAARSFDAANLDPFMESLRGFVDAYPAPPGAPGGDKKPGDPGAGPPPDKWGP